MRVAILCGGRTVEHDASVASGAAIVRAATERGHEARLVDPAAGARHGERRDLLAVLAGEPVFGELRSADLVFPAVHGGWGGDGHLQALLELAGLPFTGAGSAACALAWNKDHTLGVLRAAGVPTPPWSAWRHGRGDPPDDVWRLLSTGPLVVKEALGSSQRTLGVVRTAAQLREACQSAHDGEPLVGMPYLPGREFTVAVVGGRALPLVEINLHRPLLDQDTKARNSRTAYDCPTGVPPALARELARHAQTAHRALGLGERAYSRVDLRCDADGRPFCLEVNASPWLRPGGAFARAARACGWTYPDLIERIMDLAVAPAAALPQPPD